MPPGENPHPKFISSHYNAPNELKPSRAGASHCGKVPPRCLLPRPSHYGSSSGQSRGIRGQGCARLFPSLLRALPFSPAGGSAGPPALLPSAMATCPGAHSSFTSSTMCCSPQVSILLSHSQSAARKLGLIILGLVRVNVPFLPQERKKLQSPVVTPHRLWLLPGVDPSLGGWGPHRGKFLQDSSACAYGEGPLILGPQRIDILH